MSFSLKNVQKFFSDYPELNEFEEDVFQLAKRRAHKGIISSHDIEIFGRFVPLFRSDLLTNQVHIDIWLKEIAKVSGIRDAIVDLSNAFWKHIAERSNGLICSVGYGDLGDLGGSQIEGGLKITDGGDEWQFDHSAFADGSLGILKLFGNTTPAEMGIKITRTILRGENPRQATAQRKEVVA